MWKLHAKLLEENRRADPAENKKIAKARDLKIGQLVFIIDHQKGTFEPTYIFDHRVSGILNNSTVMLTTPDGKEKKCNIHHIKPVTPLDVFTYAFDQFQESIKKNACDTSQHQYNLRSKVKLMLFFLGSAFGHNSFDKQLFSNITTRTYQ